MNAADERNQIIQIEPEEQEPADVEHLTLNRVPHKSRSPNVTDLTFQKRQDLRSEKSRAHP
jgi:hypothetical protein